MKLEDEEVKPVKQVPKQFQQYAFTVGNKAAVGIGRKGKQDKTVSKQLMTTIEDKKAFKHKVQTVGLTRLWLIMESMHDLDFARTMLAVLPYTMPKIASVEDRDGKEIHDITDLQQMHTITIKDMRNNTSYNILAE